MGKFVLGFIAGSLTTAAAGLGLVLLFARALGG
jgi:hypothetical protein